MKFEEEFPSLIGKISEGEQYAFTEDAITEYCLDKERVKKAIDKISMYTVLREETPAYIKAINDLRKDLGFK